MNYVKIIPASCVDFNGWSTVVQLSGCHFGCKNCFNINAQNPTYGLPFTEETFQEVLTHASKPFIKSVILQGGDPLYKRNYKEVISLCKRLKEELPSKSIVVFTGYTYSEIVNDLLRLPILDTIDFLVDGRYESDNPTKKPFRGSDNQVLHTLYEGVSIKQE